MTNEQIAHHLAELNIPFVASNDLQEKLIDATGARYMKVWHDHSTIAAHGYLVVLVSFIYDPAFYYTSKEMKKLKGIGIDVPSVLHKPEVHINGRSSSSTEDQMLVFRHKTRVPKTDG